MLGLAVARLAQGETNEKDIVIYILLQKMDNLSRDSEEDLHNSFNNTS